MYFMHLKGKIMKSHFQVFKSKGKQPWRFRLVAANNEILMSSEGYASKTDAIRGMKTLVKNVNSSLIKRVMYKEVEK